MTTTMAFTADDGHALRLVRAEPADRSEALVAALDLGPLAAVVVIADGQLDVGPALAPRLVQLLGRGLLRALHEAGAVAVMSGIDGGLAGLIARGLPDPGAGARLVGVAPDELIAIPALPRAGDEARQPPLGWLSPQLLTAGAGDANAGARSRVELAQALADGQPVAMLVVGGGPATSAEVLMAVRRRWPVIVVQGSGGAADDLARQWSSSVADGDDPVLAEILADGDLSCIALGEAVGEAVESLARQLLRRCGGDSVLGQAWRRFATIDAAALAQQRHFRSSQGWILALGVVTVFLAVVQSLLKDVALKNAEPLREGLRWLLVAVPIGTSVLIAAANRAKPGKRWVLLRSTAEGIKREIYRYRLRTLAYAADDTREKNLAQAVEDLTRELARSEANTTALPAWGGPIPPPNAASAGDDGLGFLSTDQYLRLRLADQLAFYRHKSVRLEEQLSRLQLWALLAGAAGTLLAAIGGPLVIWITLTTALASACMMFLSYSQTEMTLVAYNQTATDLENLQSWWTSLQPAEQARRENIEALATHTETALAGEGAGWTQRMTDALEKLRSTQATKESEDGAREPK